MFLGILFLIIDASLLSIFDQPNRLIDYTLAVITGLIYFSVLEASTGRTIAKYITKTKVVNEKGEKPDFGTALVRSLARFIPFEAFSFLGSGTGWHDKFSNTRVIEA